jgi:hypothetical protein
MKIAYTMRIVDYPLCEVILHVPGRPSLLLTCHGPGDKERIKGEVNAWIASLRESGALPYSWRERLSTVWRGFILGLASPLLWLKKKS